MGGFLNRDRTEPISTPFVASGPQEMFRGGDVISGRNAHSVADQNQTTPPAAHRRAVEENPYCPMVVGEHEPFGRSPGRSWTVAIGSTDMVDLALAHPKIPNGGLRTSEARSCSHGGAVRRYVGADSCEA